ncbi:MAG: TspO/MBR family protein [Pseudanabaena sp. M57BS1SP1A06MG]|jgi:benzodiazapine receptor|uniref:TspO/MBR family protein n=1 Tax=Pseudanabaena mucicola TaxID=71190 RepID=UPI0025774CF3|nr:TspO/MBR family protein [Pseudanabaena mucicola]MCA6575167.1 TspO/MBR family protein [Pseudanabaena sp. M53BS1SP1A06MG]MCA6583978.1 TspO/MBR family protein [Pseudanabaena sp. M34BS1SP1A06MG]MCA6592958.1 TspO/MBR family protein [Pseudanabaena sp. M38BS1SP1A06MG]MCA6598503.1 TspO/MBR family protein [Pseudanabaena sp. M046S1SP1A06QC]MCA6600923.1 TspO/MBR family protein [Pseudanabaena sp. M57BS1SP1A06MG]
MIIAWLAIAVICFVIGFALNRVFPADYKWFMRLRRPRWLTFEGAIPFIWISIFICGITSAAVIWEVQPATFSTWLLMTGYAIVEIAVLAYTPVMTRLRNVRVGAIVGAIGFILGLVLTAQVWQVSGLAGWLLVPYLLWSPVGTYVTWVMARLNPPEI